MRRVASQSCLSVVHCCLQETKTIVLDVRNDYEWDAGHFSAAARPSEEVFNETPVGDLEDDIPLALKDADPSAPIMVGCQVV